MGKWNSTQHPVSDVRDWQKAGRLEIQPDFQRRAVWSEQAKILLIDSILRDLPMPKFFIAQTIKGEITYRIVIDGQQRIGAILSFLANDFALTKPYQGEGQGKTFKELSKDQQIDILGYQLDFNEVSNYNETELREMYGRVNRYTIALNKQELRRADFPGVFLDLCEKLSLNDYMDNAKVFTPASRKRLGDVEFTSELLAILINGIQDKKESLDSFYTEYAEWGKEDASKVEQKFLAILNDIELIFNESEFAIRATRFKQKADFYALFSAINDLHNETITGDLLNKKLVLNPERLTDLVKDLTILDENIEPNAPGKYGEYAVKCLGDSNSSSSRAWRAEFLRLILLGLYDPDLDTQKRLSLFKELIDCWDSGMCPPSIDDCVICNNEATQFKDVYCCPKGRVFLSQVKICHQDCLEGSEDNYTWLKK